MALGPFLSYFPPTCDPIIRVATDDDGESIGEFQVAEYLVFLFALDTYMRYAEETTGVDDTEDDIIRRGLRILRMADGQLDAFQSYLEQHLSTPSQKTMLRRAISMKALTPQGASRRSLQFRTLLSRGGSATMKGIFESQKYVRQVREAISASMLDDADRALDVLAALPMRNLKMRDWIDNAAKQAGSGEAAPSPVDSASKGGASEVNEIVVQNVQQLVATGAEASQIAQETRSALLDKVERDATEAARKSLEINRQPDEPPTRSEVVGVAVAAAVATMSDPARTQNIPEPLRELDDEQRAASLTDGRVLVAASAGTGKSTTLVARVTYLVKNKGVFPGRILATSFNSKAAKELKGKVAAKIGDSYASQMSGGGNSWTMHSIFKKQIMAYGNAEERTAMTGDPQKVGSITASTVQRLWGECFDEETRPVPRRKDMERLKTQWSGNGITPAQAKTVAQGKTETDAAEWYEWYEGLKGSIPGWKPPCEEKLKEVAETEYQEKVRKWRNGGQRGKMPQRRGTTAETYMAKHRPNGQRLGDFDDMLTIFLDILKRNPGVKSTIQKTYDHMMVDECQDLNQVQFDIIMNLTEHVSDATPDKSLWMVGDDKQSIYEFRGARPELFRNLANTPGWKVRTIQTNYRCEPEIVEAANRLISNNANQIDMKTLPSPHKPRGVGSVVVSNPDTEAGAAIGVVEQIKQDSLAFNEGDDRNSFYGDNAVLCRTNDELNAYEAACIIRGIPYSKKGAASFFNSSETRTVLGFTQLVTGDDNERMQKALGSVINKPNRFFVNEELAAAAVEEAVREYAKQEKIRILDVNPTAALREDRFKEILIEKLTKDRPGTFKFDKSIEALEELSNALDEMQANMGLENFKTTDLFDSILAIKGRQSKVNATTDRTEWVDVSIRDTITAAKRDSAGTDDDDGDADTQQLGNVAFLYELAKPDPSDPGDVEHDPSKPQGFKAKMSRFAARARVLNVELVKDADERRKKERQAVYLGTVHSVKGDQWGTTYVAMPLGKFPSMPRTKPGEPPPSEEEMTKQLESERRLAYVALTRAKKTLVVVCPQEVNGMQAGVSSFVGEAGLVLGENVARPGIVEPPATTLPMPSPEVKVASEEPSEYD